MINEVDLIILATPVSSIKNILPKLLAEAPPQLTLTDVGSTKNEICLSIKDCPNQHQFIPAHPMSGTEFSGPTAAIAQLFKNKACVICTQDLSQMTNSGPSEQAYHLQKVLSLFQAVGMKIIFMSPQEHDLHTSYVSHLSHISSFLLATTVLEKEKNHSTIFNLASAGFESTVRLAKSSPQMWAPIFEQNKDNILNALSSYIDHLTVFHDYLKYQDTEKILEVMIRANAIKRVLSEINKKQNPS
jgi:prephenate dehydrogenase